MAGKELEKAFLEAAEIAKQLPKNLQEAGFNRAVEQILGKGSRASGGRRSGAGGRANTNKTAEERNISELVEAIDRTAHPDVGATERVGDRALKVLQLAHHHHDVDGLTAGEIATILSRKFRLPTKANSVLKALDRETNAVDVRSGAGASRVFHIMAPGESYLERLRAGEGVGRRHRGSGRKATKNAGERRKKATVSKAPAKEKTTDKKNITTEKKATGRKVAGRPGPKAAVGQLLNAGFFRSARTIAEIQEELQHRRGHGYSLQELAPALVRSIRDESLSRERNSEGQYEYSQA
jgi:hypothetical protein